MKAIRFSALLFFLVVAGAAAAQMSQQTKLLPMLAPASPEAGNLGRYGSYQVNLFTGLPDISIPIYEIQVGDLKLPISLSYHASGMKVSGIASRVGLGWSLNAGGIITRKIQGKPDEHPNNYFSATPTSDYRVKTTSEVDQGTDAGLQYLSWVDTRTYDVEPDIFSYSFPGHSGRFLFNQKDNFKPFLIPYAPVAVSKYYISSDLFNIRFSLKDEGGRNYVFNTIENTQSSSAVGLDANTTSAWLLSDMISANTQDTIHFGYTAGGAYGNTDDYENEYEVVNDNQTGNDYYVNDLGTFGGEYVTVSTGWQELDTIYFSCGKVIFESDPLGRSDFNGLYNIQKPLKYIKVYSYDAASGAYNIIKIIQLFHSYFISGTDNSTKRLRLDSLQVQTFSGNPTQTYKFTYNTSIALPSKLSKQKDYWGYFNNRSNVRPGTTTATSVPQMQITYYQPPNPTIQTNIGGTNPNARDPDPNYMQADMLQQINYPTGGYTQFEYETNQYLDDNNNPKYAGGLRIKTIKSFTASGAVPVVKTYKYGFNESGYGRANFLLEQYFFVNHQNCRYVDIGTGPGGDCRPYCTKTMSTYFANPTTDIEGSDGSPVVYPVVTEYEGDNTTNVGKTIYQFTDRADVRTSAIGYGKPYFDSYQFIRGMLANKTVYRNDGAGSYSKVFEEKKGYQFLPYQFSTGGIGAIVRKRLVDDGSNGPINNLGTSFGTACAHFSDAYNYDYTNYDIVTGDNKLVSDTIINYQQNDATKFVQTVTTYSYDDATHLNVTQTQTTNSKGEVLKSTYVYPYNIASAPYTNMDAAHIWDKVITETKYNGASQLTQQINYYASFSGNNYLPANIVVQLKNNSPETRASFNSYDTRGNVLEMQKVNDVKLSYIWEYKKQNVIAEVTDAAQSDIAYTSFEGDGNGGWNGITSQGFSINGSLTGKRAYTQNAFSLSKSGLNNSITYTITYWSKNGAYAVNGSSATALRSFNGWTLYQHTVTPSSGTIAVSGSGTIDELRLYPFSSQMKTYTYEPLVGISSVCEVNSRISYYYYDGIGRLLMVKDDNGNIIKKFCYNYLGQPGACSIYGNAVQSGSFTKNNCSSGYTGNSVTYSVPANTYYASSQTDANTLALNDVNANGQAYANANGTCSIPPITVTGNSYIIYPYNVRFTDVSSGAQYYMYLNPNSNASTQMPAGTYNVLFYPASGSTVNTYFYVNGYSSYGSGANFYNISILSGSWVSIGN